MNRENLERLYKINHFFFDLDGTLADSKADVLGGIEQAYKTMDIKYDPSKLRIGPLLPDIVEEISPGLSVETKKKMMQTFRAIYSSDGYKNTVLFDGVFEILNKLQELGKTLYIATNKPKIATYDVLEKLGIKDMFLYIGTPDCTGEMLKKADVLKYIVSMFDLDPTDCLMFGDTVGDMEAAAFAGMKTLAFTGGYGGQEMEEVRADFRIKEYKELL